MLWPTISLEQTFAKQQTCNVGRRPTLRAFCLANSLSHMRTCYGPPSHWSRLLQNNRHAMWVFDSQGHNACIRYHKERRRTSHTLTTLLPENLVPLLTTMP